MAYYDNERGLRQPDRVMTLESIRKLAQLYDPELANFFDPVQVEPETRLLLRAKALQSAILTDNQALFNFLLATGELPILSQSKPILELVVPEVYGRGLDFLSEELYFPIDYQPNHQLNSPYYQKYLPRLMAAGIKDYHGRAWLKILSNMAYFNQEMDQGVTHPQMTQEILDTYQTVIDYLLNTTDNDQLNELVGILLVFAGNNPETGHPLIETWDYYFQDLVNRPTFQPKTKTVLLAEIYNQARWANTWPMSGQDITYEEVEEIFRHEDYHEPHYYERLIDFIKTKLPRDHDLYYLIQRALYTVVELNDLLDYPQIIEVMNLTDDLRWNDGTVAEGEVELRNLLTELEQLGQLKDCIFIYADSLSPYLHDGVEIVKEYQPILTKSAHKH